MGFLVRHPGTHSLLVDQGRPRARSLGVPVGGAADRASFLLGNALLGNMPDTVALEMTLLGPRLEATATHSGVLFGADFTVTLNGRPLAVGKTFTVQPGDLLAFQPPRHGLRAYLCMAGGFASPLLLESHSAWEPLQAGQLLKCPPSRQPTRFVRLPLPALQETGSLRVLPGTHVQQIGAETLARQSYEVLPTSNRMGLRLQGRQPLSRLGEELLSAPVCSGTVQVTNNGQPIVLGIDAQTIGGYPRAAHVIRADLDKLAQLRPENTVRFSFVDLSTAERAWREHHNWLRQWQTRLSVTAAEYYSLGERSC